MCGRFGLSARRGKHVPVRLLGVRSREVSAVRRGHQLGLQHRHCLTGFGASNSFVAAGAGPPTGNNFPPPPLDQTRQTVGRWKWLANGEYGEPVQERWASGFFKATSIKEPESLNAQDLFRWLSDVLQLSEDDIDRLLPCRDLPQATMSEHIYGRFVEFRAMRTHLQLTGETDLGHRKEMMRKYLTWFLNLRRGSTESYVGYLDKVGAVHQKGSRDVPCIQLFAGLGVTQDVVLRNLCKQIHDREKLCGTISSVSKLMWIQAVFFARHTLLGRRRLQPIWKGLPCVGIRPSDDVRAGHTAPPQDQRLSWCRMVDAERAPPPPLALQPEPLRAPRGASGLRATRRATPGQRPSVVGSGLPQMRRRTAYLSGNMHRDNWDGSARPHTHGLHTRARRPEAKHGSPSGRQRGPHNWKGASCRDAAPRRMLAQHGLPGLQRGIRPQEGGASISGAASHDQTSDAQHVEEVLLELLGGVGDEMPQKCSRHQSLLSTLAFENPDSSATSVGHDSQEG